MDIEAELISKMKKHLRISHEKLDEDIKDDITACILDMQRVGIKYDSKDELINQAIKLYLRYKFNFDNQAERYLRDYKSLRISLSMNLTRQDVL